MHAKTIVKFCLEQLNNMHICNCSFNFLLPNLFWIFVHVCVCVWWEVVSGNLNQGTRDSVHHRYTLQKSACMSSEEINDSHTVRLNYPDIIATIKTCRQWGLGPQKGPMKRHILQSGWVGCTALANMTWKTRHLAWAPWTKCKKTKNIGTFKNDGSSVKIKARCI